MSSPSNREGGAQGGRPSGVLSRVGGVVAAAAGCVAGADGAGTSEIRRMLIGRELFAETS